MSRSRTAPDRIRARYLRALTALPIPIQLPQPFETDQLTILGTHTIAEHRINFGTMTSAPRLWLAFAETEGIEPALIGYMTGLIVGEPDLWLCESTHREWVLEGHHTRDLKAAASLVWFTCQRTCDG